jgi:hypothetical protein
MRRHDDGAALDDVTSRLSRIQAVARAYDGPRSICQCNHLGDLSIGVQRSTSSQHAGLVGHGECEVPGCGCTKFSWRAWTAGFAAALSSSTRGGTQ